MTEKTRRAALAAIGTGAVLMATETVGFSRLTAQRDVVVDVADDGGAFIALSGFKEGVSYYTEPHVIEFANNIDAEIDVEVSIGPNYAIAATDAGINDSEWIPPGDTAGVTIERDGGQEELVEAAIRTPDDTFSVDISRTLLLEAAEPDATDSRFRIWLDAEKDGTVSTTEVNGEQRVDAWQDRSETTGSADAPTDDAAPIFETAGWATNDNANVAFDEPEYLTPPADVDLSNHEQMTLFAVINGDDNVSTSVRPVSLSNTSTRRIFLDHAANEAVVEIDDDTVRPAINLQDGPLVVTLVVKRGASLGDLQADSYRNGTLESQEGTSLSLGDGGELGTIPLGIGARHDGAETFAGDVAEVLLYASALDEDERTDIEDYLLSKWDIPV